MFTQTAATEDHIGLPKPIRGLLIRVCFIKAVDFARSSRWRNTKLLTGKFEKLISPLI